MPTRLIREGILSSEKIDTLDWQAEVFYRRLMSKVDDHGLYDARPSILRATLYPLRVDRVREADCSRWLAICEKAGLIALYSAGGKPYLKMLNTQWKTRSDAKYPLPPDDIGKQPLTTENSSTVVEDVVVVDVKPLSAIAGGAFAKFWTAYPRKTARKKALDVFKRLKVTDELLAAMLASLKAHQATEQWQRGVIPHPATWLNGRRWEDEVTAGRIATGPTSEWWESVDGVKAKGSELKVNRSDDDRLTGSENWAIYRLRVFDAAGDGPWLNKLDASDQRLLESLRERAA